MSEWVEIPLLIGCVVVGFLTTVRWGRLRRERKCVHHNRSTGETWLTSELIDTGMRKRWECKECGQIWT